MSAPELKKKGRSAENLQMQNPAVLREERRSGWCQTNERVKAKLVLTKDARGREAVAGDEDEGGGEDRVDGGDGLR